MLRWYDYWLRDVDTGVMNDPPVRYFVMGANEWRTGTDWPLPETQWTKLYLNSWERLTAEPFKPSSVDAYIPPDLFVQMPPTQTNRIEKLRYLSDPLPHDFLMAGPSALTLFASIDHDDTNWIITLKDVGPDPSVRTAREGEREIRSDLPSRELTRGWLKASHRVTDPERSKPWKDIGINQMAGMARIGESDAALAGHDRYWPGSARIGRVARDPGRGA